MSTLTLTPKLQITQPPSAPIPRHSISRSLMVKFCTWIEKTPGHTLLRVLIRFSVVALMGALIFQFHTTLEIGKTIFMWNGYKIPIFFGLLLLLLNMKRCVRLCASMRYRKFRSTNNQYTLNGVSVPELTDFLIEHHGFSFDDATKKLALPQRQYAKTADLLEECNVLVRGEKNARVLNEISRSMLVEQLRALAEGKATPYVWSQERTCWAERNGAFETWAMAHDFKTRKLKQEEERKERKLERLDKKIAQSAAFADLFSKTA